MSGGGRQDPAHGRGTAGHHTYADTGTDTAEHHHCQYHPSPTLQPPVRGRGGVVTVMRPWWCIAAARPLCGEICGWGWVGGLLCLYSFEKTGRNYQGSNPSPRMASTSPRAACKIISASLRINHRLTTISIVMYASTTPVAIKIALPVFMADRGRAGGDLSVWCGPWAPAQAPYCMPTASTLPTNR